ncbi:uncharacterized protein [Battus philenor]|uniref:uncharacterized protein n=1 Tax=Battus philenor TaxID=42288 RepID=UPI0035CFDF65
MDPQVRLAMFADDTALFYSDKQQGRITIRLQTAANRLGEWFRKRRININPDKSEAILFQQGLVRKEKPRLKPIPERRKLGNITLFDRPVPWKKSVKYLGVTLDSQLNFTSYIKNQPERSPTRDLNLPTNKEFFGEASRIYFQDAVHHPNHLVAQAASYKPEQNPTSEKRRLCHAVPDEDSPIPKVTRHAQARGPTIKKLPGGRRAMTTPTTERSSGDNGNAPSPTQRTDAPGGANSIK